MAELDFRGIHYRTQFHIGWYILDFAFVDIRLDVEADGEYWHSGERMAEHDQRRDQYLHECGWLTLRLTESEINESPAHCVDRIEYAIFDLRHQSTSTLTPQFH